MTDSNLQTLPILAAKNLHKSFYDGNQTLTILQGIDLTVYPGERIAIVGVSGSGKSTLLQVLGGLDFPQQGTVTLAGKSIHTLSETKRCSLRNQYLGFIYQFHHLLPEFTVLENVLLPVLLKTKITKLHKEKAMALLKAVDLHHRSHYKMAALSGGERQRTAIIRALITQPACILADEPTGNLDEATAEKVYQALIDLKQIGTALVVVTHDQRLANLMDRTLVLEKGKLTENSL